MKFTKRIIKQAFTSIFLLILSTGVKTATASHFAAVDISVQYVGAGPNDLKYKVTLMVYGDCDGVGLSPSETIRYFSVNAGHTAYNSNNLSANAPQVGPESAGGQLCPGVPSKCDDPAAQFPGYRVRKYEVTVTLPSRESDWVFYWYNSARNSGIDNLNLGTPNTFSNIFVEAGLDIIEKYDNITPQFLSNPLPYTCINQPTTYLNGIFDPLGDSLAVDGIIPMGYNVTAPFGPVPYNYVAPYSLTNPINSSTPFVLSTATGTATFTPNQIGQWVLAFRCNKYNKNGKRIGYATRDVQVSVITCIGNPPDVDEPTNLENVHVSAGQDNVTVCTGTLVSFDVKAAVSGPRNIYMEANNANIQGSTFVVTGDGTNDVTGKFIWAPHYGNIGDHILIVTAKDSTCDANSPVVFKNHRVIQIKVMPNIDAGLDKNICKEGGKPVEIYVNGADNYRLKWTTIDGGAPIGLSADTGQRVYAKPGFEGTYVVHTDDVPPLCKNKDTVTVKFDDSNGADVFPHNPIILCRPDYLQLDVAALGKPPVTPIECGISTISTVSDIAYIDISGSISVGKSYDTLGPSTPSLPNDVRSVKQQFLIRRADLFQSGLMYGSIRSIAFEAIAPPVYEYNNLKISLKCTDENTISRVKGFHSGVVEVFAATSPTALTNGWNEFTLDKPYSWDTSKHLIVEICYSANAAVLGAGNNPIIRFVPTDYVSALSLGHLTNNQCAELASSEIKQNYARPQFRFGFSETEPGAFEYNWYPSTFLSDSTIRQPLAYVPQTIKYYAATIGRSGCIVKDSADIYVPVHNYAVWPADTAICYNEGSPMRTTGGGFTFKWYKINDKGEYEILSHTDEASCWDCPNPVLKPLKTTTYKIGVYDSVWCIDTLTAKITVKPLPDIRIINRDTFVKYGQSIQLMASGARIYNWSPVGSLNNANTSYPIATPTEPTTYIAGGIGANGCRAFDTLKVDIDYRDNLFVPTGFSPNNDGKNDLFKVANLTFQKVIEFRVLNRWGQEVFMANDNRGWDGNWKGEPQDMDSYTYTIKVGFPDGYIETYRGTTTLIR